MTQIYYNNKADYMLKKRFCIMKTNNNKCTCYRVGCKDHSSSDITAAHELTGVTQGLLKPLNK